MKVTSGARHMSHAALLAAAFAVFALGYSVVVPAFEAPDEVGHFAFIRQIRSSGTLPIQRQGNLDEAQQPPLYYALSALAALPANPDDLSGAFQANPRFIWAGKGGTEAAAGIHGTAETFPYQGQALQLHLARAFSALCGAVTVALAVALGWEVFPTKRHVGLAAGALAAFNPQFLFIGGVINNDNLLTAASTALWLASVRAMKKPEQPRRWLLVGGCLAVAILAKSDGLVQGVAGLALLISAYRRRSLTVFVRGAFGILAVVVPATGWWFVRNQLLYGDPMGWAFHKQVAAQVVRRDPLKLSDVQEFLSVQFHSFWGVFGWMDVRAPDWFYQGVELLVVAGIAGLIVLAVRGGLGRLTSFQTDALALLGAAIIAQEAFVGLVISQCDASCYQGRYLFPVIAPLTIFLAVGLVGSLPSRLAPAATGALLIAGLAVAAFMPLRVIRPAYPIPTLAKWQIWLAPHHPTTLTFGQAFVLRGYSTQVSSGRSALTVTLYWQAAQKPDFDYSAFVHLIDSSNHVIAQKDGAPGASLDDPPTRWSPGDIVRDQHLIPLPPGSSLDADRLRVGVYNWSNGQQLPVSLDDGSVGHFVILPVDAR